MRRAVAGGNRRILVFGNCQAGAIADLVDRCLRDDASKPVVDFVPSFGRSPEKALANSLGNVETAIVQVDSDVDRYRGMFEGIPVVFLPVVQFQPLWPFAAAHPRNRPMPHIAYGYFTPQMGDRKLNELMEKGGSVGDIVQRYMDLDYGKLLPLDRLLEMQLKKLEIFERESPIGLADFVRQNWREREMFNSLLHPKNVLLKKLFDAVAQPLAHRMDPGKVSRAIESTGDHLAAIQIPIHPSIVAHFKLPYGGEDATYVLHQSIAVDRREYWRRYVAYDVNEAASLALFMLKTGASATTVQKYAAAALQQDPGQPQALYVRARHLQEHSREAALALLRPHLERLCCYGPALNLYLNLLIRNSQPGPALKAADQAPEEAVLPHVRLKLAGAAARLRQARLFDKHANALRRHPDATPAQIRRLAMIKLIPMLG